MLMQHIIVGEACRPISQETFWVSDPLRPQVQKSAGLLVHVN